MLGILTSPAESRMLRHFAVLLESSVDKLGDAGSWEGHVACDPDDGQSYQRLVCREQVVFDRAGVVYGLAVHRFPDTGVRTPMHDHRFPLAVLPFHPGVASGTVLYRMPWEHRRHGVVEASGVADALRPLAHAGLAELAHAGAMVQRVS